MCNKFSADEPGCRKSARYYEPILLYIYPHSEKQNFSYSNPPLGIHHCLRTCRETKRKKVCSMRWLPRNITQHPISITSHLQTHQPTIAHSFPPQKATSRTGLLILQQVKSKTKQSNKPTNHQRNKQTPPPPKPRPLRLSSHTEEPPRKTPIHITTTHHSYS